MSSCGSRVLALAALAGLAGAPAAAHAVTGSDPIVVLAGSNTQNATGTAGDGGPATAAVLFRPRAAAADAAGNVYIVQRQEAGVRAVGTDGIIRRFAGTYDNSAPAPDSPSPAATVSVTGMSGVAVDRAGDVFVADEIAGKVRRIDPTGTMTTILSGLNEALGMTTDDAGNLYLTETGAGRVIRITPGGVATTVAGTGTAGAFNGDGIPATSAQLLGPAGVAVDPAGDLFIADGPRVRRVDHSTGLISTVAGTGTGGFSGDGGPATAAQVNATGIAVDRAGNVYFCEGALGHRIRRVGTDGVITTIAGNGSAGFGGNGGPASGSVLNTPFGLSVDATGSLLIGDEGSSTVRRIINTPPVASAGAAPLSGLAPLAVRFDGSASSGVNDGIVSYAWDFGDGTSGTGAVVSHTYTAAGTYTATVRVMDASGATASATRTVSVAIPSLTLTSARFRPTWRASHIGGALVLKGSADRATTVTVTVLPGSGRGKGLLTRRAKVPAGAFTRIVALGGRILPGPHVIRVADVGAGAKLRTGEIRAVLAAPPEGVVSRAVITTALGGRPRASIRRGPGIVFADFRLANLPRKGRPLSVTWFWSGRPGPIQTKRKARTRHVNAFLRSTSGPLLPGTYRAELRAGRALIGVARTRIR